MNAAVINDAYNMLKTPNTRVKYLVSSPLARPISLTYNLHLTFN